MRSSPAGRTPLFLLPLLALALSAGSALAFDTVRCLLADGFDIPVGKPDGNGYHRARGFWPNGHLGEDWNGNSGGDTDLGDPIYAIARGVVVLSEDVKLGWGNVVIIRHAYRDTNGKIEMVDSLYGHLLERTMRVGQIVQKGDLVGKMGSNNGMYPAHLHLEIRKNLAIGMNRTKFAKDYSNYYSPISFIEGHRKLTADYRKYDIPVNTFAPHGEDLNEEQRAFAAALTARPSSPASGGDAPPPSVAGGGSPSPPPTSGVRNTGHGLSIPLNTGGKGGKPGTIPKISSATPASDTERPAPGPPPPPSDDTPKSDFWTRLKTKLSTGQAVEAGGNPGSPR